MTPYEVPETVVRRFTENGCEVTAIIADPADAQQTLYGTVTHNGTLVGS
jgi:Trk K+ transport system NAD-binding subunit